MTELEELDLLFPPDYGLLAFEDIEFFCTHGHEQVPRLDAHNRQPKGKVYTQQ